MKQFTYLLIDLGCILVPLVASFYRARPFYKEWKYFFPANLLVALVFIIWDYFFTEMGVWGFNPDYLTGIYIANLPIEEVLFFICIPYACVFSYFALQHLIPKNPIQGLVKWIIPILILGSLIVGLVHFQKWYTATTFLGLAGFLIYCQAKKKNISWAILSYLIILPFFFISNGLLTGTGINEPIVWYNDSENLGIRMFTIPVEDTFYGFLLVLMNIALFERFRPSNF